jgi:flavodoxin
MKALVVYDSTFGNTEAIARALADGLGERAEVELSRAGHVRLGGPERWDIVVIGAPTERHGVGYATQRLLHHADRLAGVPVAAFDTRYRRPRLLTGSAAEVIARELGRYGAVLADSPQSFFIRGTRGPLADGEEERARSWGGALRRRLEQMATSLPKDRHPTS